MARSRHNADATTNTDDDYIIWDARNGNVTPPPGGTYSKKDAHEQAAALNEFVLRNQSLALAALTKGAGGKVEGPFYARPVAHRKWLTGRRAGDR